MKYLYLLSGILSLLLALIGVVLPVLPTTPLLMLSCYCFSKSSDKFHIWLINSDIYKKYGKDFIENKAMTIKRKVMLLSLASIMLLFPLIILNFILKIIIIALYIYLYYYFIYEISTIKE